MQYLLIALAMAAAVEAKEWTSADYPNPMNKTEYFACGNRGPEYLCDPDGILSNEQTDSLNYVLNSLPKDTKCPCSTYSCEKQDNRGYSIGIALMRKIKRPDIVENTEEGRKGLVGRFAFDLLKKKWTWGRCEEMTVIVFSKEDGILLTLPGLTARMKLNEMAVNGIQTELARWFLKDSNIGQGLGFLVLNYRHVLDGYDYFPVLYNHVDSGAAIINLSIFSSLLATVLLRIFC